MPRTIEHDGLHKHTMNFYRGDFEKLAAFYPDLEPSVVVRRVIRDHIRMLEAKMEAPGEVTVEPTI